jgi:hypothetical protein
MYKAIILLVIPIAFNVVVGMVKHNAQSNKKSIEDHSLVITYRNKEPFVQCKDSALAIENYEINKRNWIKFYNILDTFTAIEIVKQSKVILYLRAFTVAIFITAWTFYLIIIINFLYLKYYLFTFLKIEFSLYGKENKHGSIRLYLRSNIFLPLRNTICNSNYFRPATANSMI